MKKSATVIIILATLALSGCLTIDVKLDKAETIAIVDDALTNVSRVFNNQAKVINNQGAALKALEARIGMLEVLAKKAVEPPQQKEKDYGPRNDKTSTAAD